MSDSDSEDVGDLVRSIPLSPDRVTRYVQGGGNRRTAKKYVRKTQRDNVISSDSSEYTSSDSSYSESEEIEEEESESESEEEESESEDSDDSDDCKCNGRRR